MIFFKYFSLLSSKFLSSNYHCRFSYRFKSLLMMPNGSKLVPFNKILGTFSLNIPAYSNGDDEFFSVERNFFHDIYLGYKWQCVELARRWLLMTKSCIFDQIGSAADIWTDLKSVERVIDGAHFPLKCYPNGSSEAPKKDSFLIYPSCPDMPYGHIAIITDVIPGFIRIAEQNHTFDYWPSNYAREIPLIVKDGLYYLEDEDTIFGWMQIENDNQLQPFDESKIDSILPKYKESQPSGIMKRHLISKRRVSSIRQQSLDAIDAAAQFFTEEFPSELDDFGKESYYTIDHHLLANISAASNELHRMFMEATDRVIHDDELLTTCGIPDVFWARIRHSWMTERDFTMTGRLDLAFNKKQLKVFEYNADSASALVECALIQESHAKTKHLPSKFMSAFQLHSTLVKDWKNLNINTRAHLFIEDIPEERFTATYMQRVMKEAGIDSKLCIAKINDFQWKDSMIVDSDGEPVEVIFKLWMWETVFRDYMEAKNDKTIPKQPRLSDILLNDHIRVIEPMWKVVTSNKALLPVLTSMFPNHPLLLRTEWTLTDELKKTSYVKKPIVGRCGSNVTLCDSSDDHVMEETKGQFANRNIIYQELFPLKNFDGYYSIIGSWIVGGLFAGFCVREDAKLITDGNSPVALCCIISSDEGKD